MKGLYQILAEDYREYQLKEPLRQKSKQLMESTRPSKLKALKEAEEEVKVEETPVVEEVKVEEPVVAEEAPVEAPVEQPAEVLTEGEEEKEVIKGSEEVEEEPIEEVAPDAVEEDTPEEDTPEEVLSKIAMVAGLSKEEIENAMAELPDEEKEAVKANFEAIKNTAMDLFPEEVAEDVAEITEEIPEEPFEECEISSFKVTRISPKVGAVMIEAQTKEGLKYITGKNFNESEKTLDEAEISDDKVAAANRFKSLLK
jgi:hypothetical protein